MKEGWEYKKLGEIFDITSSKRVFQSEWKNSGVPFYRAREIVQLSKNGYVDNELFITEELYSEYTEKYGKPQKGDIMVTGVGTLGICYLVKDNDKFYFKDGNIIWLKKKTDNLSEYIEYAFKSYFVKNQVDNSSGATVGTYTIVRANKTIVPIPQSISEQQHIVEELDMLSSIIEKKKAQLNELDNVAQSIFYEMFGDPITNEKGWEVKKIGEIYKVTSSKRILQSEWQSDGIPFYKVADIISLIEGKSMIPSTFIAKSTYTELKSQGLVPIQGDILVTSRGTLGKCYIVRETDEFYFQDGMITWLTKGANCVTPVYTQRLFDNNRFLSAILHNANMSTVAYLSINQIVRKTIPLPPLVLQQQFASKIEAIEHQKELIKQSIKEVETLFNSRMDYYFN